MDDTVVLAETSINNLSSIKSILQEFELASGLWVNFSKTTLIGDNFDPNFLDLACDFLHYNQESLPFKYFDLPMGSNPIFPLCGSL